MFSNAFDGCDENSVYRFFLWMWRGVDMYDKSDHDSTEKENNIPMSSKNGVDDIFLSENSLTIDTSGFLFKEKQTHKTAGATKKHKTT